MSETTTTDRSLSDQMATESGDAPATVERPAGAPGLWPFLKLPRRQKAQFFRCLKNLPTDDKGELEIDLGTMSLAVAGDAYELLADIEDSLRIAATDQKAFTTWANSAADEDVVQLFGWYMQRFQPGEASASPTS
jgi:hypothetical protein